MTSATQGPIVIISTISAREALHDIAPEFEKASGYKVDVTYGPGPELKKRIDEGMPGDVFVGPEVFSGPLIEAGRLAGATRTAFASSSTAIAVKAGVPKPDISTPEKLKSVLLAVKGVSYSAGVSGIHFVKAMEKLGIADEIAAKRVAAKPGELIGAVVARGEADIAVQQPSELMPVEGITIVGPLPEALQEPMIYGATAFSGSKQDAGNRAFMEFLRSEAARKVLRHCGLDPV
jgi:molybdate transport system substrate-binding protein